MFAEPQPSVLGPTKTCPKCSTTKELKAFYPCKGRSDGHSSYCKTCSNTNRPKYKQSERKVEYRIVAKAVARGLKPAVCPDCNHSRPPHLIRGRLVDGEVAWSCFDCRTAALKTARSGIVVKTVKRAKAKKVKRYCTWCCDPFMTSKNDQIFCSKACVWTWFHARAARVLRETEALGADGDDAFAEAHEEAMAEVRTLQECQSLLDSSPAPMAMIEPGAVTSPGAASGAFG